MATSIYEGPGVRCGGYHLYWGCESECSMLIVFSGKFQNVLLADGNHYADPESPVFE